MYCGDCALQSRFHMVICSNSHIHSLALVLNVIGQLMIPISEKQVSSPLLSVSELAVLLTWHPRVVQWSNNFEIRGIS